MDFSAFLSYVGNGITYIVPLAALIISIISLGKSAKGQKLQDQVNEFELKLKQYEIAELDKKLTASEIACVEARIINISNQKYKLKVWNSGQTTAYNISAQIDENAGIRIFNSKMPFEFLDAGKSFDEHLFVSYPINKFKITTSWEDLSGNLQKKEQMGSL